MVKKIKRKAQRGQKEKRATTTNPKTVPEEQNLTPDQVADVASAVKERKECAHLDKSMDLTKLSSKLELADGFMCEGCREGSLDRKAGKRKGKQKINKGTDSKAIWVCLECGYLGCGGVGLPTTNQSHAVRHAKQTRHPLVIRVEKSQLRWCFPCNKLLSMDKFENGEQKDVLINVVKLLKKKPSVGTAVDVEDVWFGSGSVLNEVKSGSSLSTDICGRDFYAVRGLSNLGNTCFFNSVLQNLLAMGRFQSDLLKLGDSTGPLTNSLKKLYIEINAESGVRSVLNPKSLFGCVCSKAPQFRGYQQQDSHELLRCLLDGLSTEELRVKKSRISCTKQIDPSHITTSFVDAIFGGQLSSTVCCVECGHSSTVYEPYLDLSLPVPTKKPPPRKVPTVSRNRKTKPPPKKKQTVSQNRKTKPVQGDPAPPIESFRSSLPSAVTVEEKRDSVNGSSLVCPTECGDVVDDNDYLMQRDNISASVESEGTNNFSNVPQHTFCSDESAWMDYAEPLSLVDELDLALDKVELPANEESGRTDVMQNDVFHQDVRMGCDEALLQQGKDFPDATCENSGDGFAWMEFLEPVSLADEQVWAVQPDDLATNKDSWRTDISLSNGINKDLDERSEEVLSHIEKLNVESHSFLYSYEDEAPLQVGDSEILLLPYTEEAVPFNNFPERDVEPSSSAVADADDMLGFDGFADMFNEPEVTMGPQPKPTSSAGEDLNGVLAGNSSESNPDEVDDSDSPVSIESCLSHFTKPELLADEHAWHCENCTKILLKQRRKSRKKLQPVPRTQNGFCDNLLSLGVGTNGNTTPAVSDRELQEVDMKQIRHMDAEEEDHRLTNGFSCASETSAVSQNTKKAYLTDNNVRDSSKESTGHAAAQETEEASESAGESDEEEADSKGVKAMRNATKRILINKLPSILTIHLKRFNQDARGRLSKLNGHVVFKELVDLRPYMDSRCPEKQGECKYRLIGLVEHLGSMRGGHYVAYVRGGDRRKGEESEGQTAHKSVWFYASDAHVHETTLEQVLRCEAYILFYEKV